MAVTDPLPSNWNPTVVRNGLRFAMVAGLPVNEADRATFYFEKTITYPTGTRLDTSGKPFDPSIKPIVSQPPPVQVPVAVDFNPGSIVNPDELAIGAVRTVSAVLTLLDEDFEQVKDAVEVTLGQDRYGISYAQTLGLFDIGIHQFNCYAINED